MMHAVGVLFAVALVALAAGCGGGGDEPSRRDTGSVKAILRSSAEVQRAVAPLLFCLPDEPACFRRAGPPLVAAVERQRRAIDVAVANTDHDCLRQAARMYRDSLAAYGVAGEAASDGDAAATEAALLRTTDLEIAYTEKLDECGFAEGRMAEAASALRRAGIELLRLEDEFTPCTDEPCVVKAATRGERLAGESVAAVDEMLAELPQSIPSCFPRALRDVRRAFQATRDAMQALQELDVATAEREAMRGNELNARAVEDMAACMSASGL